MIPATSLLLDAISAPLVLLDSDGRIEKINRAARAALSDGAVGHLMWDAVPDEEEREAVRDAFAACDPEQFVRVMHPVGGSMRAVEWTFSRGAEDCIVATGRDVTSEERLWRSEQHFRSMFDGSHDAVIVLDPDDEIVLEANTRACELYGVDLGDLLGRSFSRFSNDVEGLKQFVGEVLSNGFASAESVQQRADGTRILVDVRATVVDYYGRKGILSLNRNITRQRATTNALAESESKYGRLVENLPAIFWTLDEHFVTRYMSESYEQHTGFERHEVIDAGFAYWSDHIHPDDVASVRAGIERLFAEERPFELEFRLLRADGRWMWTWARVSAPYVKDGLRLADGLSIDVTARKRAEEQERSVAEFGFSALTEHDLGALMREACHLVRSATECDTALILRHDAEHRRFLLGAASGAPDQLKDLDIPDDPESLIGQAFTHIRPLLVEDITRETRFHAPLLTKLGFVSGISAVIDGPYAPYGTINVLSRSRNGFSEADAVFIRSIANLVGAAMARRAAEDETHRTRRDYERLIEIAQEGVIVLGLDARVTFANRKAGEIFGRPAGELIGEPHPEILQDHYDLRLARRDGSIVWVSVAANAIRDDDGNVTGWLAMLSDITARVTAEDELRRSEAQLREAQKIAAIGSFELCLDDDFVQWSEQMAHIVGVDPGVSRDEAFRFLQSLEGMPNDEASMLALLESRPLEARQEIERPDGERRFIHTHVTLATDERTGRRRVIGTVQDITAEREAQQALLEREARVHLLVANLPVIVWSTDRAMRVLSIAGAGVHSGVGTEDFELYLGDLTGYDVDIAGVLQGHAVTFESRMFDRDLQLHIEPLRNTDGIIVGTVGIAHDITRQKTAERANRELLDAIHRSAREWSETFDTMSSVIVLLDADGRVARLNAAALALTGAPHYRDVIGSELQAISEATLWNELAGAAAAARERREPVTVRVSEGERHWDVVASPSPTGARTTLVASDVTEIARMQENLQRSERMSAVGALVAGVAHEVRNPLFGISATLDAFEAAFGDDEFKRYIDALRDQLGRMNELMRDLLEIGRPSPAILTPGPVAPVVLTARSSVRALAAQADVDIQVQVDRTLPDVAMDRQRLLQVFENLMRNAIQHSAPRGAIEVRGHNDEEERAVVITVEDRGPGFREADLPKIFEPFFTRRRGGTGLGLSLVQRIVEDHHGRIVVSNRAGGGASVRVVLPWVGVPA